MSDRVIPAADLQFTVHEFIAQLWCDLLNVPAVAGTDNFFALGGHSLKALRMLDLAEEFYGIELGGLREINEHPTLAEFASFVAACRDTVVKPTGPHELIDVGFSD
jgi:hypothetical protein